MKPQRLAFTSAKDAVRTLLKEKHPDYDTIMLLFEKSGSSERLADVIAKECLQRHWKRLHRPSLLRGDMDALCAILRLPTLSSRQLARSVIDVFLDAGWFERFADIKQKYLGTNPTKGEVLTLLSGYTGQYGHLSSDAPKIFERLAHLSGMSPEEAEEVATRLTAHEHEFHNRIDL